MNKTLKVCKLGEEKDDFSWAMALDDEKRIEIATQLTQDLWCAANGRPFPRLDRAIVRFVTSA